MTIDGHPFTLTGQLGAVFAALYNARERGATVAELTQALYGCQVGPDYPAGVIRQRIHRLRRRLGGTGFRVVCDMRWRYRMVRVSKTDGDRPQDDPGMPFPCL